MKNENSYQNNIAVMERNSRFAEFYQLEKKKEAQEQKTCIAALRVLNSRVLMPLLKVPPKFKHMDIPRGTAVFSTAL